MGRTDRVVLTHRLSRVRPASGGVRADGADCPGEQQEQGQAVESTGGTSWPPAAEPQGAAGAESRSELSAWQSASCRFTFFLFHTTHFQRGEMHACWHSHTCLSRLLDRDTGLQRDTGAWDGSAWDQTQIDRRILWAAHGPGG